MERYRDQIFGVVNQVIMDRHVFLGLKSCNKIAMGFLPGCDMGRKNFDVACWYQGSSSCYYLKNRFRMIVETLFDVAALNGSNRNSLPAERTEDRIEYFPGNLVPKGFNVSVL